MSKSLKLALNILLHSKLRSWLTIVGIVIGVAAVVAIISMGAGLQYAVESSLGGLGADIITVTPGASRAMGIFGAGRSREMGSIQMGNVKTETKQSELTVKDIQVLKPIENIEFIQGIVSSRGEAYYLGEKASVSIEGVDPLVWSKMTTSELESGRFLGPSDYNMVVVGSRIAESTFKQPLALNRIITIEGTSFKIVGILKESGTGGDDNKIIMSYKAARGILDDVGPDEFDSIIIKAADSDAIEQIIGDADEKLMISRHVTEREKDFTITSLTSMQERVSETTESTTMFLAAIAAVSLLVGAVGIANTMFTTVLEKTKEIGIMKAIGAKNHDIMMIFMLNSVMVGLVGGVLGVILGSVASLFVSSLGIPMAGRFGGGAGNLITPEIVIFALLIAVGIGMASGVIPAYRASKLKPVDALRYE